MKEDIIGLLRQEKDMLFRGIIDECVQAIARNHFPERFKQLQSYIFEELDGLGDYLMSGNNEMFFNNKTLSFLTTMESIFQVKQQKILFENKRKKIMNFM